MKPKSVLLSFLTILFIGCKQPTKKEGVSTSETAIIPSQVVADYNTNWIKAINSSNISTIEKEYASNAIKVISADSILESAQQIANYYQSKKTKITTTASLFSVEASKEKGIHYEIISYKDKDLEEYVQIVIWKLENGEAQRVFEFTEKRNSETEKVDTQEIDQKRNLWITLCNENSAENLVKQLYTNNAIYYNHKPLVKGEKELIKEYAYMNNPDYNLSLQRLKLEVVNANYVFEIGQCGGSYNGKYILVWKKQVNGNWEIEMDSNI